MTLLAIDVFPRLEQLEKEVSHLKSLLAHIEKTSLAIFEDIEKKSLTLSCKNLSPLVPGKFLFDENGLPVGLWDGEELMTHGYYQAE